ncbi:MAG: SEC-C domain-containing protein, partial [Planctomycetales bacterium]|nr:SEC-C domain-containing protein [Planctomycetales bacterium]
VITFKDGSEEWGTIIDDSDDSLIFRSQDGKRKETHQKSSLRSYQHRGRPVLVGTTSIEKSEKLSAMLERRGIKHEVLNAKQHRREAEIVAQAGRKGAVTIATNMAGRGTDIILGGNPETLAWAQLQDKYTSRLDVPRQEWDALVHEIEQREGMKTQGKEIKELGGLHVIGTERHEARRIDLQLRGRCGRQGDPGSSRFYLSLRDDLMRIFAGPWVEKILKSMGMQEGEAIESPVVTRRIEAAQKKVEERNFEIRKNLLEYDEVMDEQRKRVYSYRQQILDGVNCKSLIMRMIDDEVEHFVSMFLAPHYGTETFARWAGSQLSTTLDPKDFVNEDFNSAERIAHDEAERMAETQIHDAVEENLPEDVEDTSEWNWSALAKFANTRWGLNFRDHELKQAGRDGVMQLMLDRVRSRIADIDLSDGAPFLEDDFGIRNTQGWVRAKFGFDVDLDELRRLESPEVAQLISGLAEKAYDEREAAYPIMAAIYRFTTHSGGQPRLDRGAIAQWARDRFRVTIDEDDFKNKQREEIRDLLVAFSKESQKRADEFGQAVIQKVDRLWDGHDPESMIVHTQIKERNVEDLLHWAADELDAELTYDGVRRLTKAELLRQLETAVEDRFRPEIRRMERSLVLQLVDTAWKDHLLSMDHLRSAVSLVGYAQVDPKVEYKREGKRLFDEMWNSLGQRVTDLVFRMEQLDERFVGSTWVESKAVHEQAPSTSEIAQQQEAAIQSSQGGDTKTEPIRNREVRVGRNEPCPCGSGKKYKNCCMRNRGAA